VQPDLDDPYKFRVAAEIVDLLSFYNTGTGSVRDIVRKMRIVVEAYCTATYPGFFDSEDTLTSIVAKIRGSAEQHPACALLDELDEIHAFSHDYESANPSAADELDQFVDVRELRTFVWRTLKIVGVRPNPRVDFSMKN
jgi:hypothetical protein